MKNAVLLLTFTPLLALATATAAPSWPAYRGPQGDGTTTEKVGKTLWPSAGPKKLWTAETPTGFSSFAVDAGRAFTLVQKEIDGVPTEVCLALDAATGKSLWSKDIVAEHGGRNIQWKSAASPLLEDGLIYVAGGGEGEALLAIKADSGEVAWKAEDDKMTHATPVAATIHGVRQVVFFTQNGLVAVGPKDGKVLWRYNFPYRVSTAASPIVHQDMVYCAAGYGVGMGCAKILKKGSGFEAEELWRKEGDKVTNHWSSPVVKDGHLYGMFSFKKYGKGPVTCLEMATGEVKWSQDGFGPGNLILTGGDTLLALSDTGELVLIPASPDKYKEIARADVLDGKCWSTPVLANGTIFARSTKEAVAVDVTK